ncbi:glycosyltransferase family 2 protein [Candidatus Enterococcus clewellii]|uniref:Glycosyltransferase 2-like domain-containing protein n=1 Tax=Candidatus Enterococcus clewellii TaxID=1834193 RepID=A0A242K2Q4_9ENTE|nr:glycosyltransferase family 2 protein [Enterococcus sp. 9E7_DIV0242]OTP12870.1 hypothetical protein A5888_003451 [Enterococcus sp. 9E7_DIV0242]
MKVLLVIPAYNEESNILKTISSIDRFNQRKNGDYLLNYIVINDGSTDGTKEILEKANIPAIHLVSNLGIGGAVQTGYKYAFGHDYDIAVQFDGDGQHDIDSLDDLIKPILEKEADFSIGSRFLPGAKAEFQTTPMRRMGIKILSSFVRFSTREKIYDVTSGYRAANKKVIAYFAERYPISYPEPESIVHLFKKKFSVVERPVAMMERTGGVSSIQSLTSVKYMIEVSLAILVSGFMKEKD